MKRNFYLPTNFTNNAERCQNIELVKIRATYKVAIISTLCYSCIFVKFVGHKKQLKDLPFALHVGLQNDAGSDFADKGFVAPPLLPQPAVDHGTVGKHGGETFVVESDGYVGQSLTQFAAKRLDALLIFRRPPVRLRGQTDNEKFHALAAHIVFEPIEEFGGIYGRQPVRNDFQGVGNGNACAALTVVEGKNARHLWGFEENLTIIVNKKIMSHE